MNNVDFRMLPFHDHAVYVSFGQTVDQRHLFVIQHLLECLKKDPIVGLMEAVPGYHNITFYFSMDFIFQTHTTNSYELMATTIQEWIHKQPALSQRSTGRLIQIPVVYGDEEGQDLATVANYTQLTPEEVIEKHSAAQYTVHMVGFSPGFPFLGGMPTELATPRKETPSPSIPAGSVGIAGEQTGIYPLATPGGWQIIGRTHVSLFDIDLPEPAICQPGDVIQFIPIHPDERIDWPGVKIC